ncbi:hypothetical protein COCVIDRAFT_17068 [Bipolaris victoriae FI3]|uniref:Uncharacterized protein n=1 Tax=Bipolaris victoriae (strain FI3) TaxID=930091 RepID=W7EC88_BIPV3|nr:hypothetical protein COCVIDRAFT_17068 [Bipolaris victoriae FI3]
MHLSLSRHCPHGGTVPPRRISILYLLGAALLVFGGNGGPTPYSGRPAPHLLYTSFAMFKSRRGEKPRIEENPPAPLHPPNLAGTGIGGRTPEDFMLLTLDMGLVGGPSYIGNAHNRLGKAKYCVQSKRCGYRYSLICAAEQIPRVDLEADPPPTCLLATDSECCLVELRVLSGKKVPLLMAGECCFCVIKAQSTVDVGVGTISRALAVHAASIKQCQTSNPLSPSLDLWAQRRQPFDWWHFCATGTHASRFRPPGVSSRVDVSL